MRLRRTRRVEAELWQTASNTFLVKNSETTITCTSGDAFATDSSTFERLQRVVNSCERAYHRALKEIQRLQAQPKVGQALPPANPDPVSQKPTPEPAPQPEQSKPTSGKMGSVRQKPKPPPVAPFAQPGAGANPAEPRPSSADRDPKPPQTA
jgi:hypothetical protein